MAQPTVDELAKKLGVGKKKEAPAAKKKQGSAPKKRGSYFKTTPKKDAMITISTTSAVKEFVDAACVSERKTRSTLITEIIEAHMEATEKN